MDRKMALSLRKIEEKVGYQVIEFLVLFYGFPLYFYFNATRWNIHAAMWIISGYALLWLQQAPAFSWRDMWHGIPWTARQKKISVIRYFLSLPPLIGLTLYLVPERLFSFPVQHTAFWLLVMVLYPILSVLPQEILFRAFFFQRYERLFKSETIIVVSSALSFAFVHCVFHNWVSPLLCAVGGLMFADNYRRHRSLKWAVIEHAAYGCTVFTVGIGTFFLVNGGRFH